MRRLLLLVMVVGAGCTHVTFTQPMREAYELGIVPDGEGEAGAGKPGRAPDDLQYFVSNRIVLQREVSSRSEALAKGRIVVRKGRTLEQVIIRRGTPGVAVDWGPDWVAVSFEKGTRLYFDLVDTTTSERPTHERYPASIDGEDLPASYYQLRTEEKGNAYSVDFEGREYFAVGGTRNAKLEVQRFAVTKKRRARRVLRGRRVD